MQKIESKKYLCISSNKVHNARKESTHIITTHFSKVMDRNDDWKLHPLVGADRIV